MYKLNSKIRDLLPYEPISGDFKIRLDANESYLPFPKELSDEIKLGLEKTQINRYPDSKALELCKSFADFYGLNAENVVAGNGSDELISILVSTFLLKGENYAVFSKDFSMYNFYGSIYEANCITIEKNEDWTIDVKKAVEICKENGVKMLIFSNPCNPTSLGLGREDVKFLIENLSDTLIVLDEAYMEFWTQSLMEDVLNYDNLIILKTCSKAFGMAGIRVGFAVSQKNIVDAIKAVKSPYNLNSISQMIATKLLLRKDILLDATAKITAQTEKLYNAVKLLEKEKSLFTVLETKTNFVALKCDKAKEIWEYLKNKGIAVRCFGDFLRINAGSDEENEALLYEINNYIKGA